MNNYREIIKKNGVSHTHTHTLKEWFFQGDRSKAPPDLNEQLKVNY
jgi:hypothetical protein